MEPGPLLGIVAILLILVQTGWLIQRFFAAPATWRAAACHWLVILIGAAAICGGAFGVNEYLDLLDSSHGVWTLAMPVMVAVTAALVALSAFMFAVFHRTIRGRRHAL